jgi:hypothetical protein
MIDKALGIPGWMSEPELTWLAQQAKDKQFIVEFGCYLGRSTRALADNTDGVIYAVDPWDGTYYNDDGSIADWINTNVLDVFVGNLKEYIDSGKVVPVKEFSWAFRPIFKADMVFIDGDHRYHEVKNDIVHALAIVKSGGIISGHDYSHYTWPGVKQAVDELLGTVKHCDSIWWTKIL